MLQFHWTLSLALMVTFTGEKKLSPTVTEVVAAVTEGETGLAITSKPVKSSIHCGLRNPTLEIQLRKLLFIC
jgi:hypothetical protein